LRQGRLDIRRRTEAASAKVAPAAEGARFVLRTATAAAHERLDRLYSRFDLGRTEDYGAFLVAHAPAFLAVEAALEAAGAPDLLDGWRARRRGGALLQDIAALGLDAPPPAPAPRLCGEPAILGAAYVLEGSRLGGAMLIRAVPPGLPTAFLQPGNPAEWRAFISVLDARLSSQARLAEALSAAHAVFALFERAARAQLEPTGLDC
jgi:heme oxygenase